MWALLCASRAARVVQGVRSVSKLSLLTVPRCWTAQRGVELHLNGKKKKQKASSTDKARSRHHPRRQRRVPRVVGGFVDSSLSTFCCCLFLTLSAIFHLIRWQNESEQTQLPVMDVSARTTTKDAAKCDKHCDLQDSVNQQEVERIFLFRVILESMFASVPARFGVFMLHGSIGYIDACVSVVLGMRNVEHLLRKRCYV